MTLYTKDHHMCTTKIITKMILLLLINNKKSRSDELALSLYQHYLETWPLWALSGDLAPMGTIWRLGPYGHSDEKGVLTSMTHST